MKSHTTYKIYPKAINEFINDNYDLNTINFGNIQNNITAILQKLKLDTILDCEWDINPLYFFDKPNISKNHNKPSDFEEYANFKFIFRAKNSVSTKEYENAIEKLESEFINKYQNRIQSEFMLHKEKLSIAKRKKERMIYILSFVVFIIIIFAILIVKKPF